MIYFYALCVVLYLNFGLGFIFTLNLTVDHGFVWRDLIGIIGWPIFLAIFGIMFWVRLVVDAKDRRAMQRELKSPFSQAGD